MYFSWFVYLLIGFLFLIYILIFRTLRYQYILFGGEKLPLAIVESIFNLFFRETSRIGHDVPAIRIEDRIGPVYKEDRAQKP